MTSKRMLIDASHPEETRVAIVAGNHLEDFDVEVQSRRQLKGNIYLAKVTRVEPSLQAAFVDYGGNRHGFLAFNEIHPDYYQIPVADREALIAEQKVTPHPEGDPAQPRDEAAGAASAPSAAGPEPAAVETVGGDIFEEVAQRRPTAHRRRYKIQEVIKRRQILLVQVVKEERGTKGAALTTYLSLAGRYCVLMPNTARGGGISRKIGSGGDRKRLKSILSDFGIPEGMAVIVRTAGEKRSKAEIKRDYEYLMRLWSAVREVTLESMAPCLVHEEGDLIKRSIRDLYTKDIQEIVIDGDESYRAAKDFMKLLIPSHTKRVQPFKEVDKHLFQFYGLEHQLDSMHSPEVQLRSGGYIVISPTEALVAIDVNSGRATRGRNIEETALKTNLEAADEIALQLKLRDLAGLIVIDFIDMEDHRNQVKVERRLKDAMRSDRARIQIGRISPFGLLELSRQRMRPSLIETSSEPCPYCEGSGIRRSKDSAALHLLRAIEDEGMQHRSRQVIVHTPTPVALYILNNKRSALARIEEKFKMSVRMESDDTLIPPKFRIDRIGDDGVPIVAVEPGSASRDGARDDGGKRRRRRGRRHHGDDGDARREAPEAAATATAADGAHGGEGDGGDDSKPATAETRAAASNGAPRSQDDPSAPRGKRRRRGRRGGRRHRRDGETRQGGATPPSATGSAQPAAAADADAGAANPAAAAPASSAGAAPAAPKGAGGAVIPLPDAGNRAPPQKRGGRRRRGRGGKAPSGGGEPHPAGGAKNATPFPQQPPKAAAAPTPAPDARPTPAPDARPTPAGGGATAAASSPTLAPKPAQPAAAAEPARAAPVAVVDAARPVETQEKPAARKGWWRRVTE